MDLTSADLLLPYLSLNFPTASNELMRSCLNRAAVAFCQKSFAWQETLDAIPVINSIDEYDLEMPDATTELVDLVYAWYGGRKLDGVSVSMLNRNDPDWLNAKGTPQSVTVLSRGKVRVVPTPQSEASGATMRAMCALSPKLNNIDTKIPVDLVYRWQDTILAGAKAYMLEIKGQPWTDVVDSLRNKADFTRGCVDARIEWMHGGVESDIVAQSPAFGVSA